MVSDVDVDGVPRSNGEPPAKRPRPNPGTTASESGGETETDEQRRACAAVAAGRNVFVTGPAGTGKSHLVRTVVARTVHPPTSVFVTATTGVAALHIGGTTVHAFAGIGIGTDPGEILRRVRSNAAAGDRWRRCRLLVIDEVSMLAAETLDRLDAVARSVRGRPAEAFGGIQVVLVGDFLTGRRSEWAWGVGRGCE
jgi:ATP-dependent DNA helicase PIF1